MTNTYSTRLFHLTLASVLIFLTFCPAALAKDDGDEARKPTSLREALEAGKYYVAFRYRLEQVGDDAPAVRDKDALASTLRTVLGYRSKSFAGFSFFLEAENVTAIGNDQLYRNAGAGDLGNGVTGRPVVADPEITEINQALLQLEAGGTTLQAGRREITIDNHRFVGHVGWRQNHQSFDNFTFLNSSLAKVDFSYHFIHNVNRIFGDNKPMESHLGHAAIDLGNSGKLSLYAYLLDYDNPGDSVLSTDTFGIRYTGSSPWGSGKLLYNLEYADQSDGGDNPLNVSAAYYLAEVAGAFPKVTVKAGYEVLEGSLGSGRVTTPLATLHAFNGWADKFLSTPATGLEDLYLNLSGSIKKAKWMAVYHDFSANSGSRDYGTELDLQLTYKADWGQTFGIKAAFYDADTHAFDSDKVWFWTAFRLGN